MVGDRNSSHLIVVETLPEFHLSFRASCILLFDRKCRIAMATALSYDNFAVSVR